MGSKIGTRAGLYECTRAYVRHDHILYRYIRDLDPGPVLIFGNGPGLHANLIVRIQSRIYAYKEIMAEGDHSTEQVRRGRTGREGVRGVKQFSPFYTWGHNTDSLEHKFSNT